jgi:hypothetical protein
VSKYGERILYEMKLGISTFHRFVSRWCGKISVRLRMWWFLGIGLRKVWFERWEVVIGLTFGTIVGLGRFPYV